MLCSRERAAHIEKAHVRKPFKAPGGPSKVIRRSSLGHRHCGKGQSNDQKPQAVERACHADDRGQKQAGTGAGNAPMMSVVGVGGQPEKLASKKAA